ncbi:PLD nuclease N-terminal domain-containing protein [Pseudomonas coleopterorum]|uniref:PLDc_N domain-containing protein n=1 Tax=Pseudomonas coleopterorum TaxID=1605838 RepID=A0ABR9C3L1_9PSED|nr:PLD nuclease N-terminal domain-containing protein [Pseudomonas coleopterorum]MBD8480401.1 PLDc_N domain-containing protein [Pseudomonas coleopterorum]MBD8755676.1 PLDc_N domain-containing protein [Pseudomonas coleopterorum]MBD8771656.1 PLDc_N domain-containing protein [Pseudomonas coleopterorum]
METPIFWTASTVIVLLLDAWVLTSVWRSTKSSGTKLGWTVLIFILPVLGLAIWGIAGPRGVAIPPTSDSHSKG